MQRANMTKTSPIHPSDVLGFTRLAFDATAGLTDLVEGMHLNIARKPGILGPPFEGPSRGIAGLVYQSIRAVTGLVGSGIDALLTPLVPLLGERNSPPGREAVLAALNGAMGDYLAGTRNPLAISMSLRRDGKSLSLESRDLARAIPSLSNKPLVLVHGLCMSDLQWTRKGHNHGAALARDLGYTPVHLHYNSGLHISTNGRAFASLVETLVDRWPVPVEELAIVGHSMGGMLSRSAYHYATAAGYDWPRYLRKIVFLGTPHHGAPLERGGAWVNTAFGLSPYTAALARLGRIRSAGITDLRYGNLLDDRIGPGATVSALHPTRAARCLCRITYSVTPWRRPPGKKRALSPPCSEMAWCPWIAPWAATKIRSAHWHFPNPGSGSVMA